MGADAALFWHFQCLLGVPQSLCSSWEPSGHHWRPPGKSFAWRYQRISFRLSSAIFQTFIQGALASVLLGIGPDILGTIKPRPSIPGSLKALKTPQIPGPFSKFLPHLDQVVVWWFREHTRMPQKSAFYFWTGIFWNTWRAFLDAGNSVADRHVFSWFSEQISCLRVCCGVLGNQAGFVTDLCSCDLCNISFQEMAFL